MARYWIGGAGNWDDVTTTHWSVTSGGTGGASVPTSVDDIFFDLNSGLSGATITMTGNSMACNSLSMTVGASWILTGSNKAIDISGSANFESGAVITGQMRFISDLVGNSIITNGCGSANMAYSIGTSGGAGNGTFLLHDDITSSLAIILRNGTLDMNGFNITSSIFSTVSTVQKGLLMRSGTFILTASVWDALTGAGNFTLNAGTSTIKLTLTSSSNIAFDGGSKTYNNILISRGSSVGNTTFSGDNTFNEIRDVGTASHSIKFNIGSTQTIANWSISGTPGNLITINSTTTGTHTLNKSGGGTILCDYVNVQHSVATPSNTWYADSHSINNQAVTTPGSGWNFSLPIGTYSNQTRNSSTFGNQNYNNSNYQNQSESNSSWSNQIKS